MVLPQDPEHGATTEPVVFAQLTVRSGTQFTGQISAQGRSVQHGGPRPDDWTQDSIPFSSATAGAPPPSRGLERTQQGPLSSRGAHFRV